MTKSIGHRSLEDGTNVLLIDEEPVDARASVTWEAQWLAWALASTYAKGYERGTQAGAQSGFDTARELFSRQEITLNVEHQPIALDVNFPDELHIGSMPARVSTRTVTARDSSGRILETLDLEKDAKS